MSAPTIETERLVLRPHRVDDFEARSAIMRDALVTTHLGGPQSEEESWARILRYAGHWALLGFGLFAIEERASGRLAGEAGFGDFHRGFGPDFDDAPEGAWLLAAWAQGKGYASEAMRAAIGWHERMFGPKRMVCVVAQANGPSLHVASKLGFVRFSERDYRGARTVLLERRAGNGTKTDR